MSDHLHNNSSVSETAGISDMEGQQSNEYNLTGLVKKLQKLEPEFSEVKEQAKNVTKRGGLAARLKKKVSEGEDE